MHSTHRPASLDPYFPVQRKQTEVSLKQRIGYDNASRSVASFGLWPVLSTHNIQSYQYFHGQTLVHVRMICAYSETSAQKPDIRPSPRDSGIPFPTELLSPYPQTRNSASIHHTPRRRRPWRVSVNFGVFSTSYGFHPSSPESLYVHKTHNQVRSAGTDQTVDPQHDQAIHCMVLYGA